MAPKGLTLSDGELVKPESNGFSLIEVIVAMAVLFSLVSFMTLNLSGSTNTANFSGSVYTFIADFKNQQTKAMQGDTEGRGTPDTYSIFINSSSYTLFHGSTYNSADLTNFDINTPVGYQITTTFPGSQIVFTKGSGEINPYMEGANSITIRNIRTTEQKVIQVNKYGIITSIN